MELLTNREIAVLFWLAASAAFVFAKESIRKAAVGVLRALFSRHLIPVYATTAVYISLITWFLALVGIWNDSHLKMTLIWAFFVALAEIFRMPTRAGEFIKFRQLFFDQLKVLVIVEYLVDYSSFSLVGELALVPILTFVVLLQSMSEGKEDLRPVYNLSTGILVVALIAYLWAAGREISADFESFASTKTLADFALPPLLTVLFLPYLFGLSLYSIYQTVFSALGVFIKDADIRRFAQSTSIMTFGTNIELLHRWRRDMVISKPKTKDEVRSLTRDVLRRHKNESTRRYYAPGEGWDPYVAKDFLAELGVETDEYHSFSETPNEWFASATIREPGDKYIGNHFSYYVDGEESVANTLKFDVSVFDDQNVDETIKKYLTFANMLAEKALGCPLSVTLIESMKNRRNHTEDLAGHAAIVEIYEYIKSVGGFEIKFTIRVKTPEFARATK